MLAAPFTSDFLSRLEALRLITRKEFLGGRSGSYSSPRRGTSLEFADYRRYAPGDDLRYLDWGIYARSDRLYVKLFREEVDLFSYLFVDASGSMGYPSAAEKFLPACHVALALAYVVLANHDHVKLHLLEGGAARVTPFYQGRQRLADLIGFVSTAAPRGEIDLAAALAEQLKKIRRPGKAIILSDFLMPVAACQRGLNTLRAFNLDICVIQVLSRQEVEPPFARGGVEVVDCESGAEERLLWNEQLRGDYQKALERHSREIRSFCHQAGIHYSLYVTDQEMSEFVLETLPAIGLFK
ncbi:MAG TPA: DUF58 domain-containing protein [Candidatus Acidoferrales bacterium]|nr:DUF58 domain-containing protein [Candidatus Acidoferrales bacterium]